MTTATITKPSKKRAASKRSAAPQIDKIASDFGLTVDPTDFHGPDLRRQLLSSYIEWLEMERRCASSDLWPQHPNGEFEIKPGVTTKIIPANTRWGGFHFADRGPGSKPWYERPHPVTRAALVLTAVGAIDDIVDPLHEMILKLENGERRVSETDGAQSERIYKSQVLPLWERLKEPPAPTTMNGAAAALRLVKKGIRHGVSIADEALVDTVIRFLAREEPGEQSKTVDTVTVGRDEQDGDLLPLIAADKAACEAYNAHELDEGDESDRLEAEMHAAGHALEVAILTRGENCRTLAEAEAATARAVYYYQGQTDIAAGLALSALAFFLGEEAVS